MASEASAETSRGEKIKIKIEQHTLTAGVWFAAWSTPVAFSTSAFDKECSPS